jgi:hypothetical protein
VGDSMERLEAGCRCGSLVIVDPGPLCETFHNIPHFVASDLARFIPLLLTH